MKTWRAVALFASLSLAVPLGASVAEVRNAAPKGYSVVQHQQMDDLVYASDAVVIGALHHELPAAEGGPCARVEVEEVLDGRVSHYITVRFGPNVQPPRERAVYFLKTIDQDRYAPLDPRNGCQRMLGDGFERWDSLGLDDLKERIRRVQEIRRIRDGLRSGRIRVDYPR